MDNIWIYTLGFAGQAFFGSRLIVQLVLSEKAGRVLSPTVFWYLSVAGAFLFLIYGFLRTDLVIVTGQTLSYYIYLRNLHLKGAWPALPVEIRAFLLLLPAVPFFVFGLRGMTSVLLENNQALHPLFILGIIGQLALNLRFVYQWYVSEREGSSVLSAGFWHISTWASVLVIIYAAHNPVTGKADPVLLLSQTLGIFVYARNLILHYRNK